MGSRGPSPARLRRAAGRWIGPPPITRERASEILEADIPLEVWEQLAQAFDSYADWAALIDQVTTKAAYAKRHGSTAKKLVDALEEIKSLYGNELTLEIEREAQASVAGAAGTLDTRLRVHLYDAAHALSRALAVVRAAGDPTEMRLPTDAQARSGLAK